MKSIRNLAVLLAVMALLVSLLGGCAKEATPTEAADLTFDTAETDFGTGASAFTFEVTNTECTTKSFTVHTDETVVGKALLDAGLIAGEDSDYGLYVKTVLGITLDYDTDGK